MDCSPCSYSWTRELTLCTMHLKIAGQRGREREKERDRERDGERKLKEREGDKERERGSEKRERKREGKEIELYREEKEGEVYIRRSLRIALIYIFLFILMVNLMRKALKSFLCSQKRLKWTG